MFSTHEFQNTHTQDLQKEFEEAYENDYSSDGEEIEEDDYDGEERVIKNTPNNDNLSPSDGEVEDVGEDVQDGEKETTAGENTTYVHNNSQLLWKENEFDDEKEEHYWREALEAAEK